MRHQTCSRGFPLARQAAPNFFLRPYRSPRSHSTRVLHRSPGRSLHFRIIERTGSYTERTLTLLVLPILFSPPCSPPPPPSRLPPPPQKWTKGIIGDESAGEKVYDTRFTPAKEFYKCATPAKRFDACKAFYAAGFQCKCKFIDVCQIRAGVTASKDGNGGQDKLSQEWCAGRESTCYETTVQDQCAKQVRLSASEYY